MDNTQLLECKEQRDSVIAQINQNSDIADKKIAVVVLTDEEGVLTVVTQLPTEGAFEMLSILLMDMHQDLERIKTNN